MSTPAPPAPFEKPWHGQAFALVVALNEAGHFSWPEWADTLGATLKLHGAKRSLDGSDDYYTAWVAALETLLQHKGLAEAGLLETMKANWETAFLETPHGQPVHPKLPRGL